MGAVLVAEFEVDGIPVPQGSKSGWVSNAGPKPRAILHDQNAKTLKPWRATVTAAAREAYAGERIEGPVFLVLEFRFVRPKSVKREWPAVKPDIDKTVRSVLDGITDSGLWRDDSQVVTLRASKVYADRPGVHVQIGEYSTTQPKEKK
jgi:Holliday junction resolvase RusA-like endonuclease